MSDPALQILMQHLPQARGRTVWVVDEHGDAAIAKGIAPRADLIALSNRCDVVQVLQYAGHTALLSDFSFAPWSEDSLDTVVYRISKEKAVVHHVINAAVACLRPGGELWLIGDRQEGIKTYLDKAVQRAGGTLTVESANKQVNAASNCTFNDGVFTAGDRGEIDAGASARSIIQDTGMTLRLDGTATTGTRTLAARGRLSWFAASNAEIVVSGAGVT